MSAIVTKETVGASAPSVLSVDFETRSRVDLKNTGAYVYARHPSTDIWCMAFAFDDEEVGLWTPDDCGCAYAKIGDDVYHDSHCAIWRIIEHVKGGGEIRAWNARFERMIWTHILGPRYGFPVPEMEQFVDTAAEAAAMALPRALEDAAKALGLPVEKDAAGARLMKQMAKPRRPTKNDPREWWDDEDRRRRLYDYCKQDVRVERAVAKKLRRLSSHERELYLLDQKVNDRGVRVDVQLVHAAKRIVSIAEERADAKLAVLTDGAVTSISQRDKTKEWLNNRGVEIDNLRKDTLRDLLASPDELGEIERAVAELRADNAKSSTKKLDKFLTALGDDERIRDLLLYHGAGTGRWSGKLIQPQNFPRGEYWSNTGQLVRLKNVEQYIPLVLAGDFDGLADSGHPPLAIISALLRSMLIASPGHRLVAADFSQIEARVLAWIAEQDDLVEMFRVGGKIYEDMAAFMQTRKLGRPVTAAEIEEDSVERQLGKNTVLGCGFQMGWETFQEQAWVQQAVAISDEDAKLAVQSYRERYPRIVQFWWDIERAAIRAVENPGSVQSVGRGGSIRFKHVGNWLWCVLPSGRPLAYASPTIAVRETKWGPKRGLQFMGISSRGNNRKWRALHAYGGFLTENVVQAMARDIMASAMLRAERHGYPVVLTVHDEVVTDTPIGHGSAEHFEKLMCVRPRWAEGLPVAAKAWEGERYRK